MRRLVKPPLRTAIFLIRLRHGVRTNLSNVKPLLALCSGLSYLNALMYFIGLESQSDKGNCFGATKDR
jgi:hypothetical protein